MLFKPPPSATTFDFGGNAEPSFVCRFIKIFRRVFRAVGPAGFSVAVKGTGEVTLLPVSAFETCSGRIMAD